jgi:hypothetical protein
MTNERYSPVQDDDDDDEPLFTPDEERDFKKKLEEIEARLQNQPKPISGLRVAQRPEFPRLRYRASILCLVVDVVGTLLCGTMYSRDAYLLGIVIIFSAIATAVAILGEVLFGSGFDIQTQYIGPDGPFRKYRFQPSISNPVLLLCSLALVVVSIVLGYAVVYFSLCKEGAINLSQPLDGFSSFYFSIVTFSTVGYGDFYPRNVLGKLIVSSEIGVAIFVITVVLATSISWVLARQQELLAARASEQADKTLRLERLMKEAGIGLYMKMDESHVPPKFRQKQSDSPQEPDGENSSEQGSER